MAEAPLTQPNATTFLIEELVGFVQEGRIRVPDFQRPLRWQWEDVRRLFDSILRGYPIGSMLFWSRGAPEATIQLGALVVKAPSLREALWVVDGQQRITSLANALSDAGSKDPRFALAYDLRSRSLGAPVEGDALSLPLPVLFDLQRLLKWFAGNPEAADHLDEATRVAKAIRQYTAPAYIVKQDDEAVLRDIFDRMNNFGKRLSRAEVFSALHSGERGDDQPRNLADIAEHLDARFGFGLLDEDTILRALLARRGADVTRDIRGEFQTTRASREFPGELADEANRKTEEALERAIAFLQVDANVPHLGFLPYRYLLVVLARFFAHHPEPDRRNRGLLRRWFWRAAIVGPVVARGVYTAAMRALAGCVDPHDETRSVVDLLGAIATGSPSRFTFAFPDRFKSTMAEVRFVLCALWHLHPRSLTTGEPYEFGALSVALNGRVTASEVLDVCLPKARGARGATANRVILLGDDAAGREVLGERPIYFAEDTWRAVLDSHALNEPLARLLQEGNAQAFVTQRAALMDSITRAFLERMTETSFEDTPPLDELEFDDDGDVLDSDDDADGDDA